MARTGEGPPEDDGSAAAGAGPSTPAGPDSGGAAPAGGGSAGAEPAAQQSVGTAASRGFLWANVGVFTRYASALVLAALLARVLTTTEYAVMVTLMVVTYYFDNALDMGMGAALVYEQETGITERVQVAFTATLGITVVLSSVAFLGAPVIAGYFKIPDYVNVLRCLAVVVVLSGCTAIPWSLFVRSMDFRRRAVVEVARDLTRFGLTVGLALAGFGAWAVMIGLLGAYFVWFAMTWFFMRFRPTLAWDLTIAKQLFAYAWRMAGSRLLGVLSLNGDYVVVGNRRPDQYPQYYQAFRLPEFIMGAQLNAMSAVLFPMYSRIRSEGTMPMREALYKALRLVALFSLPVGVGLALVARDSIAIMYGLDGETALRGDPDDAGAGVGRLLRRAGVRDGGPALRARSPRRDGADQRRHGPGDAHRHVVRRAPGRRLGGDRPPGGRRGVHRHPPAHREPDRGRPARTGRRVARSGGDHRHVCGRGRSAGPTDDRRGALSLLLIVLGGALGGLIGLGISASARAEALDLVAKLRG